MAVAAAACPGLTRSRTVVAASPCALRRAGSAPSAAAPRVVTLPCAFVASEVHASSSSVAFSEGRRSILNAAARPAESRRRGGLAVRGLFGLGVPELAVIAGVAALVFGPKQLPLIGKNLGKTVKSFQQAAQEFKSEISNSKEEGEGLKSGSVSDAEQQPKSEIITSTPIATPSTKSEKDTS